jgi:uncharacterized membrane protein
MNPENQNNEEVNSEESVAEEVVDENVEQEVESDEVKESKTFAILGYILPFLFFLPLIDDKSKNVPFARFHANQQLILLIAILGVQFIHGIILVSLSGLGYLIMNVFSFAILALVILGGINSHKGKMKELPFIGHFRILK